MGGVGQTHWYSFPLLVPQPVVLPSTGSSATHFAATQAMRSVLTLPGRLLHGPTRATSGGYFVLLRNEAIRDVEQTICPGD